MLWSACCTAVLHNDCLIAAACTGNAQRHRTVQGCTKALHCSGLTICIQSTSLLLGTIAQYLHVMLQSIEGWDVDLSTGNEVYVVAHTTAKIY